MSTNLYTRAQRLHRLAHKLPETQAVETIRAMLVVIHKQGIARGIEHFARIKGDADTTHPKGVENG